MIQTVAPEKQLKQDYAATPIPFQIVLEVVSVAEKAGLLVQRKGEPLKIGFGRDLPQWYRGDLAPQLFWDDLPEGGRVAAFSITSPEAKAIRVGLRLDQLPEGVEVRFFSIQNGQSYGPFTVKSTHSHTIGDETHESEAAAESLFWSPVIEGETAGVEIYVPAAVEEPFSIEVPQVQHLVYSVQDPDDKALQDIGRSGSCNIDVKCRTTTPSNLSNAVAKIIFTSGGSTGLCTGTLLNDKDDSSWIPYFMTANHCLSTQSVASTLNSYWFFERATCGGANPTSVTQMVGGADLLATGTNTDFTFLRLRDAQISSLPDLWFSGWTSTNPTGRPVIGVHHPDGDLKKWSGGTANSFANYLGSVNGTGNYIHTTWTQGTTEGGSSGSGLFVVTGEFDNQHLFVGNLHGGYASCTNPSAPDWYGRFDRTYPSVSQWLEASAPQCSVSAVSPNSTTAGDWSSSDCQSVQRSGSYADYYSFTLTGSAEVTIDLESSVDSYLYLHAGAGTTGAVIAQDDDGGAGTNARIVRTLSAGSYTVQATTYASGQTGAYRLVLRSGGDPATTLITHYYVSILERAPEPDGLAFWQGLVTERQARGEDVKPVFRWMAEFFFFSPEYLSRNTTDRQFITNLYLTFFQRAPDEGGYAFWLGQLAQGMSRDEAMSGFLYSPEFTDFMEQVLEGGSSDNLPSDPGEEGLTTLEGIDSDRDGVRDDLQRLIALDFPGDEFDTLRAMLTDTAVAAQQLLTNATDQEAVIEQMQKIVAILACLEQSYPNHSGLWGILRAGLLNTQARTDAYLAAHRQLAGHTEILSNLGGDECALYASQSSLITTHSLVSSKFRLQQFSQKLNARTAEAACGGKGSYIFFGNGMFNDYPSAVKSMQKLEFLLNGEIETALQPGENLLYGLSYNFNEFIVTQLLEVLRQWDSGILDTFLNSIGTRLDVANRFIRQWLLMSILSSELPDDLLRSLILQQVVEALATIVNTGTSLNLEYEYTRDEDLQRHVEQYSELLGRDKRVLVVSHSQGNFYANLAHGLIQQRQPGLISGFGVYGVATPANRVAGTDNGEHTYTKLRDDLVVGPVPGSLLGNETNVSNNGDWSGHEFISSYIFGDRSGPKMAREIPAALANLRHPEQVVGDGIITVRLTWGSQPDVDLHVFEPNGAHVYYSNKRGLSGYLDVDDTSSYGPEHYYVGCDTVEQGTYRIGVNYFSGSGPEIALVNVNAGDVSRTFTVHLSRAVGSTGNSNPIPVADITVNRDELTGLYRYQVQGR